MASTERRASPRLSRASDRARPRCRSCSAGRPLGGRLELRDDPGQALGDRVVDLPGQPLPLLAHSRVAGLDDELVVQRGVLGHRPLQPLVGQGELVDGLLALVVLPLDEVAVLAEHEEQPRVDAEHHEVDDDPGPLDVPHPADLRGSRRRRRDEDQRVPGRPGQQGERVEVPDEREEPVPRRQHDERRGEDGEPVRIQEGGPARPPAAPAGTRSATPRRGRPRSPSRRGPVPPFVGTANATTVENASMRNGSARMAGGS